MGQHDLPDKVLLEKAAAGAQRILSHLCKANEEGAGQCVEGNLDQLQESIDSLRQLTELLKKESASQ